MTERTKELSLAAVIVGTIVLGLVWGALASGVSPGEPQAVPGLFTERSLFCPGVPDGAMGTQSLAIGALGDEEVRVELEPQDKEPREPLGETGLFLAQERNGASNVVGYGGAVGAGTSHDFSAPVAGVGSAPCAQKASRDWYLPFGSSAQGSNELLYLYNPFPDEAVVRVTFYDENGPISKARLADVAVPAGETTTVRVNKFILQQETLAAQVTAVRGRVVTWKTIFSGGDQAKGAALSVGAAEPSALWYFPGGAVGPGIDQRVSLLNPTDDEAIVSVSLLGDSDIAQPPELLEMTLPRQSARDISLAEMVPKDASGSISVIVQSINEVPIVAERAVWYGEGAFNGFQAELGAPEAAQAWWLSPAIAEPDRDSIVVLNAGEEAVQVNVEFQGPDGPVQADGVGTINLQPGARARVPLEGLDDPGSTLAIVRADGPVVAERVAYSSELGDVAAVMGIPILRLP